MHRGIANKRRPDARRDLLRRRPHAQRERRARLAVFKGHPFLLSLAAHHCGRDGKRTRNTHNIEHATVGNPGGLEYQSLLRSRAVRFFGGLNVFNVFDVAPRKIRVRAQVKRDGVAQRVDFE